MTQTFLNYEPDQNDLVQETQNNTTEDVSKKETGTDIIDFKQYDITVLFKAGGSDHILDEIEKRAKSIDLDVTTEKGRKEIASMAYKIARTKTTFDDAGKQLKADAQKKVDEIDAERKKARDRLDALKEDIRAPLTEFENREKERVDNHKKALDFITNSLSFDILDPDTVLISQRITALSDIFQRDWEEFKDTATHSFEKAENHLKEMLEARKKRDLEQAELDQLRKQEELRKQQQREKEIADNARKEAEEKAERERIELERKASEEIARLEREAKEIELRAQREKEQAIEAERQRVADEKSREELERKKREADKHNKEMVINAAVDALCAQVNLDKGVALTIIMLIGENKLPNVHINY